jgi:ABC-2 type transport system ATP-binding protein
VKNETGRVGNGDRVAKWRSGAGIVCSGKLEVVVTPNGTVSLDNGLRTRGLAKSFGPQTAVAGLDLDVRSGEIFGLVGPDGAGKTTTLRMLAGILDPDAGDAWVGGISVREDPEGVKGIIGYMSQRFSLYGDLTVAENIYFFANLFHVPADERIRREQQLLEASRMTPFRDRLAKDLSGGMKQKLALTCTLIHRPRILYLDEPTTGVDPVSRRDFWKILYGLVREGMTLVVSTPYMDEAERCNRIAFLHQGRVLRCAGPRELKREIPGELVEVNGINTAGLGAGSDGLPPGEPCRTPPLCEPTGSVSADGRPAARGSQVPESDQRAICLSDIPGVTGIQVFGSRLHVSVPSAAAAMPLIARRLAAAGHPNHTLRPIHPGLEDVFISLVQGDSSSEKGRPS